MNRARFLFFLLIFLNSYSGFSQSTASILFLNEVSQGTQGQQEYVEFIVYGSAGCSSIPLINMAGFVIDDNNGEYLPASNPGSNLSNGAIRFANTSFWNLIPQGTIIVIYNENDRNPAIPPDDYSMIDGNGRLIMPANCYLLEGQGASPSASTTNPSNISTSASAPWISGAGQWSYLSMEDNGDTFRANYYQGISYFQAICWGTNTGNPQVSDRYFPGSATGLVFYADLLPGTSGMVAGPVATCQTPGYANTPANAQYIQEATGINPALQLSVSSVSETCFNACDAEMTAQVSGGTAPYTYSWNGISTGNVNTVQSYCAGTYIVSATDAVGCTVQSTVVIEAVEELTYTIDHSDETCFNLCDGTISLNVSGGTGQISVNWAQGYTGTELTGLCADDYMATILDANGCTLEIQQTVNNGQPTVSSVFTATGPFQEGDAPIQLTNSVSGGTYTTTGCSNCLTASGLFDPSIAGAGAYQICYTPPGNCALTNCATFIVNPCTPKHTEETIYICEGDSALIFGEWQSQPDSFTHTFQGALCDSLHEIKLLYYDTPDAFTPIGLCEGDSIFLFGNWIDTATTFSQEAFSSHGCRYTVNFTITESFCAEEIILYIPNTFTPNGDQINDVFRIEMIGGMVEEGYIFNRWGELIAKFDSETLTWDGTNEKGQPSPDGIYSYLVIYTPINGTRDLVAGHVSLLR